MGMIRGEFDVVEPGAPPPAPKEAAPPSAPCPAEAEPAPAPVETYVVQRGDTLMRIAKKKYGDAARWRDISAANPGVHEGRLKRGQVLTLPPKARP